MNIPHPEMKSDAKRPACNSCGSKPRQTRGVEDREAGVGNQPQNVDPATDGDDEGEA